MWARPAATTPTPAAWSPLVRPVPPAMKETSGSWAARRTTLPRCGGKERQQLQFEEQQTEMAEDKTLFENLRQLRLKIASERDVPPYVIFSDKTLHQLAIVQPITYIAFGSISGIGTRKLESLGTIFVKAIREYKGLSTNETEEWNDKNINKDIEIKDSVTTPKAKKSVRDFVTFNGTEYHIGSELMGCIKWRTTIENVSKDVYYTLWQENRYPMTRYISEDVQCRDMVVKRFAEIISAVYNVEVSPDYQTVIIPVRTEYDENGKPVHSLEGVSFEEALDKFKQFVEQNGHLPFAISGEYECSLPAGLPSIMVRWQRSVTILLCSWIVISRMLTSQRLHRHLLRKKKSCVRRR